MDFLSSTGKIKMASLEHVIASRARSLPNISDGEMTWGDTCPKILMIHYDVIRGSDAIQYSRNPMIDIPAAKPTNIHASTLH